MREPGTPSCWPQDVDCDGNLMNEHLDDQSKRWESFLASVPSSWLPVAAAFHGAFGVVQGEHESDGTWSIDLMFGLTEPRILLRAAPVRFRAVTSGQDVWLHQHVEQEGGVLVAEDARVVVSWSDNFASGVNATLSVYASDVRYRDAVEKACARHREVYNDDEDEAVRHNQVAIASRVT